jgi:hypothetical protein
LKLKSRNGIGCLDYGKLMMVEDVGIHGCVWGDCEEKRTDNGA